MKPNRIVKSDFDTPALRGRLRLVKEVARALDEKASVLPHSVRVEVTDLETFIQAMSPMRLRLLKSLTRKGMSVSELAVKMERDPSTVRKDLAALTAMGLVQAESVANPGHGVKKVVRPAAASIEVNGLFAFA